MESHGKANYMLLENKKAKRQIKIIEKKQMSLKQALISVQIDTSTHFIYYNAGECGY